jgi:DNA polymerase-3 subunit alpha
MTDAATQDSSSATTEPRPFVHLHCHTHYSLLDGANRIPDLVKSAKANGMNAISITDHGNMYGAMEFYNTCNKHEVKPIIGYEAYVAPGHRTDRSASRMKQAQSHLTLLAMNQTGFYNLVEMASQAYLEGFHYKPRIDRELLEEKSEGIICLSGCASSELSKLLLADEFDKARKLCEWYSQVFGDRFYMEIQNSNIEIQRICLEKTVDLANQMGFPLVATNDAHYLKRSDAIIQDILLCVNTRTTRSDPNRMKMTGDELHVRSPAEMYEAFPGLEDTVARSQEIADRVDIQLAERKLYPVFKPPENKTDIAYLRELCTQKMHERYRDEITDKHWERLDYELSVIEPKGYASYFLIVWDFVRFAKEKGIPCGARGSACGSIVAYLLGMSDVCPLKYDLLFERFLNPQRNEPPDIDIDFCRDRRQMVIDYTKETYGESNVAQIGTFGTLKAKAGIRDVGRALSMPLKRVDELCKMIPDTLNISLNDSLKESADLKQAYKSDPQVTELIDLAIGIEGLARSAGTHAAGVVVADVPLRTVIPLQKITGKTDIITQWDGPTVEDIGLLKMDFLGLRNLTILDKSIDNVKQTHPDFSLEKLQENLTDPDTFALLQRGETKGIFQLESGGMRDLLTKMKPDCFNDIIATSALYRPGPLEGGMVTDYVEVKHGRQKPRKVHPVVDEVLAETHGVMVYQEQVMRILNRVGNIDLSNAYQCIKAISKKKLKTIAQYREEYVAGARSNGISEKVAIELFELIEKFAGYGFNKSHSTAYALIAYETAYLKAHYPVEFMAALLSCGMESTERINEHVDDARRMKIEIKPPDVNTSFVEFSVQGEAVGFGLGAIKGVGINALQAMVTEREANGPFKDIYNLTERVDPKALNKGNLETLIKAGALDSFGPNRGQHMLVAERAVNAAVSVQKDKARGQKSLFGDDDDEVDDAGVSTSNVELPPAEDWTQSHKLAAEKEVIGFYLTSHPLTQHSARIEQHRTHSCLQLGELDDQVEVVLCGMVAAIKITQTKKPSRNGNQRYANFDLEDPTGVVRCIIWPDDYARNEELIKRDTIIVLMGRIDRRGREPNVIVNKIMTLEHAEKEFTAQIAIKFQRGLHSTNDMQRVREVINRYPGKTDIVVVVDSFGTDQSAAQTNSEPTGNGTSAETPRIDPGHSEPAAPSSRMRYVMTTGADCMVSCSSELRKELADILGPGHIQLTARSRKSANNSQSTGR